MNHQEKLSLDVECHDEKSQTEAPAGAGITYSLGKKKVVWTLLIASAAFLVVLVANNAVIGTTITPPRDYDNVVVLANNINQGEDEQEEGWEDYDEFNLRLLKGPQAGKGQGAPNPGLIQKSTNAPCSTARNIQLVFVQFIQQGRIVNINATEPGSSTPTTLQKLDLTDTFSTDDQNAVIKSLEEKFKGFNVFFTLDKPADNCVYVTASVNFTDFNSYIPLDYKAIIFNCPGILAAWNGTGPQISWKDCPGGILAGEYTGSLDFLNVLKTVDKGFYEVLVNPYWMRALYELFGKVFKEGWNLIDLKVATNYMPTFENYKNALTNFTANILAHEIGHSMGLEHFDAIGDIGYFNGERPQVFNVYESFVIIPTRFNGSATDNHIMGSGSSTGQTLGYYTRPGQFFSERSALKLALAFEYGKGQDGTSKFMDEAQAKVYGTVEGLQLKTLVVPNTILNGTNAGKNLKTEALVIFGNISVGGEVDTYRFKFNSGDIITIEAKHQYFYDYRGNVTVYMTIELRQLDGNGNCLPDGVGGCQYMRRNIQGYNPLSPRVTDPMIFDVNITQSGNYEIVVNADLFCSVGYCVRSKFKYGSGCNSSLQSNCASLRRSIDCCYQYMSKIPSDFTFIRNTTSTPTTWYLPPNPWREAETITQVQSESRKYVPLPDGNYLDDFCARFPNQYVCQKVHGVGSYALLVYNVDRALGP